MRPSPAFRSISSQKPILLKAAQKRKSAQPEDGVESMIHSQKPLSINNNTNS